VEFVADRRALVIMDNCEHLLADAADVGQRLVGSCPSLSVLANSRESLSIPDEHTYRVDSLGVSGAPQEPSGRPPSPTGPGWLRIGDGQLSTEGSPSPLSPKRRHGGSPAHRWRGPACGGLR
jgi:hypothetical protein